MFQLFLNMVLLFAAAGLLGFAAGWLLRSWAIGVAERALEDDIAALKRAIGEAQVRRARASP